MSAARQLIADARREGATFHLIGDRLRLVPNTGRALSPDLIARAKALRSDVVAALSPDRSDNLSVREQSSAGLTPRKNREAQRSGLTDRWCDCGSLAPFAWPIGDRREVWRCLACTPATDFNHRS